MHRNWLLTWTTYGTWLPGDQRGFVSPLRDEAGKRVIHNEHGTPYDADMPGLKRYAENIMKGPPIWLVQEQAIEVLGQFRTTAQYRGWPLWAAAIMANHVHLVTSLACEPAKALHDFKSYASRVLNQRWGKRPNGTWWTQSGSRRLLPDESAVYAAIRYVKKQRRPLLVWVNPEIESGACQGPANNPNATDGSSPGP